MTQIQPCRWSAIGLPKTYLTLLLCTFFLPVISFSQLRVGGSIGAVSSYINSNHWDATIQFDYEQMGTFQANLNCEMSLSDQLAIQPELMYSQQGARFRFNESDFLYQGEGSGYLKINNIEIPLLAKLKWNMGSLRLHFLAGASIGFGLPSESYVKAEETVWPFQTITTRQNVRHVFVREGYNPNALGDFDLPTARTNFNLHFGAGMGFNLKACTLFVELRYIHGLTDLFPESRDVHNGADEYSRRLGLSAGVMFPVQ